MDLYMVMFFNLLVFSEYLIGSKTMLKTKFLRE